jgi:cytochrome c
MACNRFVLFAATAIIGMSAAFAPALAAGDAEKGEKEFRRCAACHSVDEGANRVGPSLYNIIGRQAGTAPDYNYSDAYVEAGEKGLVWTEELIVTYLEDPKAFLVDFLESDDVSTKMRNKFKKLSLRENIAAYLASISPEPAESTEESAAE